MPETQVPVIPIPENVQFGEIPAVIEMLLAKKAEAFTAPMFLFDVVTAGWKAASGPAQRPSRMLLMSMDEQLGRAIIETCNMIEHKDAQRLGPAPARTAKPFVYREKASLRQAFKWMEEAPATVLTYTIQGEEHFHTVALLRTPETIENFSQEFRRYTRTFDAPN